MKTLLKKLSLCAVATVTSISFTYSQTGQIIHDLSTGVVNGSSTLIPFGSLDDTWVVKRGPLKPALAAYACSNLNGVWAVNGCARWITPKLAADGIQPDGVAEVGTYIYQTNFNLTTTCYPWVKVNFSYLGGDDNITSFYLNGHSYPLSPATPNDFSTLTQNVSFNLDPGQLVLGTNTIQVWITNSVGPNGFFACGNVTAGFCTFSSNISLHQEDSKTFNIYPNPSTGKFVLALEDAIEGSVEVTDMLGRKIRNFHITPTATIYSIDLSKELKGIYIVSLRTNKAVQIRRITLE